MGGAAGRRLRPAGREQQGSGGRAAKGERRPLARHGLQRERGTCAPRGLLHGGEWSAAAAALTGQGWAGVPWRGPGARER